MLAYMCRSLVLGEVTTQGTVYGPPKGQAAPSRAAAPEGFLLPLPEGGGCRFHLFCASSFLSVVEHRQGGGAPPPKDVGEKL